MIRISGIHIDITHTYYTHIHVHLCGACEVQLWLTSMSCLAIGSMLSQLSILQTSIDHCLTSILTSDQWNIQNRWRMEQREKEREFQQFLPANLFTATTYCPHIPCWHGWDGFIREMADCRSVLYSSFISGFYRWKTFLMQMRSQNVLDAFFLLLLLVLVI